MAPTKDAFSDGGNKWKVSEMEVLLAKVAFIAEKRVDIPRDRTDLVDLMRSKVLVNPEKQSGVRVFVFCS